jgi:hypothetical protein
VANVTTKPPLKAGQPGNGLRNILMTIEFGQPESVGRVSQERDPDAGPFVLGTESCREPRIAARCRSCFQEGIFHDSTSA